MKKDSIFWKIEEKKGGSPSFLFGTVHVQHKAMPNLLDFVKPYMESSALYAGEMDLSVLNRETVEFQAAPILPNGLSLDKMLTKGQWKSLDFWSKKRIGQPAIFLARFFPIQVIGMLSASAFDDGPSLDQQLNTLAISLEKPTFGLESWEKQRRIMQSISLDQQVDYLKKTLKAISGGSQAEEKLMQRYLHGRSAALYQSVKKSAGKMRKTLIYERNKEMADRFEALSQQGTLFASVGAAHLAGLFGMLRFLKQKGMKVSPLSVSVR